MKASIGSGVRKLGHVAGPCIRNRWNQVDGEGRLFRSVRAVRWTGSGG